METTEKKGGFFDDDNDTELVCLSSDTDDDEQLAPAAGLANAKTINGDGGSKVKTTLLDMGFKVRGSGKEGAPGVVLNGHANGGNRSSTATRPKIEPGTGGDNEPQVFTVDDDDDSEFEIEYARNDDGIFGKVTQAPDDSDDDEIQVLEDGGPPVRFAKKRTSQESRVNLGIPGLNLGLIAAGNNNRLKNEESSSQEDIEKIDGEEENDTDVTEEVDTELKDDDNSGRVFGESKPSTSVDCAEASRLALVRFINEFCARKHRGINKDNLNKAKQKMLNAFEKIKHFHKPIHIRLKQEIEDATEIIRCTKDQHWKTVKYLLDLMDPKKVGSLESQTEDERKKEREKKKMQLRIKYEKELEKMQRRIRRLEVAEVDWDDENDHNSSYILGDKYKLKLIAAYYTLCDLSNCNHLTGRPIQTRINLRKHNGGSNIEAIDTAVEKFINKKGFMFAPDYTDILEIITETNQSRGLGLSLEEVLRTAQQMFENVIKIIKKRREKDFKMSMLALLPKSRTSGPPVVPEHADGSPAPVIVEDDDSDSMEGRFQDPAEVDAELKAKLEKNDELKGSEGEVIDKFCKLAEGQLAVVVEDENANDSPQTSDNEEEDEEDYDDEVNSAKVSNEHEHEELTEDEDEEAETVSSGWKGSILTENLEDDDNSNEDKTTAESESDNNVDMAEENVCGDTENDVQMIESPTPIIASTSTPLVESTAEAGAESKEAVATVTDFSKEADQSSDDIQPPPNKRMRADENFNDDSDSKTEVAAEKETKTATEALPV